MPMTMTMANNLFFRHSSPYNIKDIHTMYNVKNNHAALKKIKIYNHNLTCLIQYLCIIFVIKNHMGLKLIHWMFKNMMFLILFIKLNTGTNFLLKGGKFRTSQIRNNQECALYSPHHCKFIRFFQACSATCTCPPGKLYFQRVV